MNYTKQWYLSKGIWGAAAVLIATGFQLAGYTVDSAEFQNTIEQILSWVMQGTQIFGALLAMWGRISATERIE